MKNHPEFQIERERLLLRREEYKQLIHSDLHAIKKSLNHFSMAKDFIGEAVGSFRGNGAAAQGSRLALSLLPGGWLSRPWVGMAASALLPLLLRRLPGVFDFVRGEKPLVSKAKILGQMKNGVSRLRERIREKR